jgi:hypothetical protein
MPHVGIVIRVGDVINSRNAHSIASRRLSKTNLSSIAVPPPARVQKLVTVIAAHQNLLSCNDGWAQGATHPVPQGGMLTFNSVKSWSLLYRTPATANARPCALPPQYRADHQQKRIPRPIESPTCGCCGKTLLNHRGLRTDFRGSSSHPSAFVDSAFAARLRLPLGGGRGSRSAQKQRDSRAQNSRILPV